MTFLIVFILTEHAQMRMLTLHRKKRLHVIVQSTTFNANEL